MLRNGSKFRLMIYFEIAFNLISIICQDKSVWATHRQTSVSLKNILDPSMDR